VVAIDGKTLRGSKRDRSGSGALHVVSAYAHEAGLVLAARAVETKGNAIPELLDMLALEGAIVTIDAMGTQKAIAEKIVARKGDYVLASKENQPALHADVEEFFADPALAKSCAEHPETDAGHGRIEERRARVADAGWLAKRHPHWKGLQSIAAIDCLRRDKKTGAASKETRFYISSLPPDPQRILAASRAHWSIENNLHWTLDVTFREDECRTRKDYSALNLAVVRHAALDILKGEASKIPIKRKRVKAAVNPDFRAALLKC
jgi:predicted transposase YbfD/YdcC